MKHTHHDEKLKKVTYEFKLERIAQVVHKPYVIDKLEAPNEVSVSEHFFSKNKNKGRSKGSQNKPKPVIMNQQISLP